MLDGQPSTDARPGQDLDGPRRNGPGLYQVGDDGRVISLGIGSYAVDAKGGVKPVPGMEKILERLPWEKTGEVLDFMSKRGNRARLVETLGKYLLTAGIIGAATVLAFKRQVSGEAVGYLFSAAIGFVLGTRGREQ